MIYLRYARFTDNNPEATPPPVYLPDCLPPRVGKRPIPAPAHSQHWNHEPLLDTTEFFVTNPRGSPKLALDKRHGLFSTGDTGWRWLQQLGQPEPGKS